MTPTMKISAGSTPSSHFTYRWTDDHLMSLLRLREQVATGHGMLRRRETNCSSVALALASPGREWGRVPGKIPGGYRNNVVRTQLGT